MMKLTPLLAAKITTATLVLCGCHPPPLNCSRITFCLFKLYKILTVVSAICVIVPLIVFIYASRNDISVLTRAVIYNFGYVQMISKVVVFLVHQKRLQAMSCHFYINIHSKHNKANSEFRNTKHNETKFNLS